MNRNHKEYDSGISETLKIASSAGGKKRFRRWIGWSISALVISFVIVRWLAGSAGERVQYKTQASVRGNLSVTVSATGNLKPTNQVDVGSELSGIIKYVDKDYNDHVKVGQALTRLDTSKLNAQVLQSKASLGSAQAKVLQAQATVKEAKNELARLEYLRDLSDSKAVSRHDLDAAEAALDRAVSDESSCRAEVSRTKAVLEANETDLSKAVIRSPINGIVLARSVEPGQTVAASLQAPVLFTLAEDLTKMKLHVDVDEADVGQIKEGQEATFTVDAYPDRRFPARIIQVRYGSKTTDGVVTYETVLDVDNSDLSLRPGMTATAEITVERIVDAVLVPNAALRFTPLSQEKEKSSQTGGIISKLMPRPPRPSGKKAEDKNEAVPGACVWMLRDGSPVAVPVVTGVTDGALTVIREGSVPPGMLLVVDTVRVKK